MSLPPPSQNQAYCDISALEGGHVRVPLQWVLDTAKDGEKMNAPGLSFLLRHSSNNDTMLVDIGVRKDWENLPKALVERLTKIGFVVDVPQDVPTSLRNGGIDPASIKNVLITHIHFDHYGDTTSFTVAKFLVGSEGADIATSANVPANLLPQGRTAFLSPHTSEPSFGHWSPIGPFAHALDFYKDGSLYIIDAPGHLPGHINVLARTSADGGWVYLAGDTAHDHRLINGEAKVAYTEAFGCAHHDKAGAEKHIERVRELKEKNDRVRVILAHDEPWYQRNKGGSAFLPGKLESL